MPSSATCGAKTSNFCSPDLFHWSRTTRPEKAGIDFGKPPLEASGKQIGVGDGGQIFRYRPQIFFRGQPVDFVESGQIHRSRIAAQAFLPLQIEVVLEVRHHEFAQSPVNGLAKSQPCVVRFRDGSPVIAVLEDRNHMVIVTDSFEIKQKRGPTMRLQSSRRQQGSFEAMCQPVTKHSFRRADRLPIEFLVIRNVFVEKALDLFRRFEPSEFSHRLS